MTSSWRCVHCGGFHEGKKVRSWGAVSYSLCKECDEMLFPPFPWGKFTFCIGILILFGLIVL